MLILITVIVILAICLFYIRRYYKIPSLDAIKEIVSNSSISSIHVRSKFFKIRTLTYVNRDKIIQPESIIEPPPKAIIKIKSKMVGTFTYAEHLEDESLIFLGKKIKEEDVIGYISTLGISTEIITPINGKIVQIMVCDYLPVEFNKVIMHIEEL